MITRLLLLFCIVANANAFYREYKIKEIPRNINTTYLRDSLRYLALTSQSETIINTTFSDKSTSKIKLMTFTQEGIRVLIISNLITGVQSVNIISLHNAEDIYRSVAKTMIKHTPFTFMVNSFYSKQYGGIRERIIQNISRGVVTINAIGSASVYGTLLAIELSSLQIPVDKIVLFGGARFTDDKTHQSIAHTFASKMVSITHERDISHKMQLRRKYASSIPNQYIICDRITQCNNDIFTLKHFNITKLIRHFSNVPHLYSEIYHDSLLAYHEIYNN
ncbi:MAG: hypothetical protein ACI9CD_000173 [Candidatus Deianiraeaceae bacterium]|jgi:hypothetical protein